MSSYILFSQTSTALGQRDQWTNAGSSGGVQAPGNTAASSAFNADQAGSSVLPDAAAQADFAADGIRQTSTAAMFDISQDSGGGLTPNGGTGAAAVNGLAGSAVFGNASSKLEATSIVDAATGVLHLGQSDANWNGIKNLEIKLDSQATFHDIRLENFVDTRLQIGDDACALVAKRQLDTFDVQMLGVKRGEFDGTLATNDIDLRIDVWSNEKTWQNSFDLKGSVYGDAFEIGAGNVTGSSFKGVAATHDGTGTTVFSNMGAGDDSYDSSVSAGFKAIDNVWGGTGDDTISTGANADKIFGDNGSGAGFYADPADVVEEIDDDFIAEALAAPGPPGASAPIVLAADGIALNREGYTVTATGGELTLLRTGGSGTEAGGLGIRSLTDGTSLAEAEVDLRGPDESIKITFDTGAHEVEIDLSAFFSNEGLNGATAEKVDYVVELADGSTFSRTETSTTSAVPAKHTIVIDEADTGGKLIKSVTLAGNPAVLANGEPISDFYIAAIRACVVTPGADGNDVLNAGTGADFVQGDGDTGSFTVPGETCIDFITGAALSGFSVDIGPAQAIAVGGTFAKVGNGTTFGGLSIMSASDQLNTFTQEIDAFNDGVQEGVIFAFDSAVAGFDMDLNLFFGDTDFEPLAEVADYIIHLQGGPDIFGTLTATDLDAPGLLSFDFDTGGTGGKLITGFEIRPSLTPVGGTPYSEFTIAKICVDDKMISTAGDRLDLGVDTDKDTVNFNDGDGFDVVRNFDTAKDVLRMQSGEVITKTVVVDAVEGVGTLVEHGADGDGVFLVGVVNTAAITIITF